MAGILGPDSHEGTEAPPVVPPAEVEATLPWEQVANGRYMPRRIRGSCVGRELG